MSLAAGDRLGPYEVAALIGKGGMGEVYRGTDTRLGRPVAIKVSSREFNDRFEREARAISALNHPNICTLYDVGPNYLVMELVEGEMLSTLLDRGPLPLDKALLYAGQIVDALAAAHAKGIIHRDLKPGNIIITKNGVKVLDFGLAKLSSERLSSGSGTSIETVTEPITKAGTVLGTLYYMSPEQVEGKDTDERSDIFSFGVVLYEMITGQRAFSGDTQAAVLASLLKDQPPPMNQRQPAVPRGLERLVRKCLEKKPDDRWQSARDLKPALELIDLEAPPASASTASVPIPVQTPPAAEKRPAKWLWAAVAAGVVIAATGVWALWPKPAPARVTRFSVDLPEGVQINPTAFYVRVSPDGSKLAFTTVGEKAGIWIRELDSVEARLLPGTEGVQSPFWSPDSKSMAFGVGNKVMRVDISGGPPQVLGQSEWTVGSGFWTEDGEIVFGGRGRGPLQKVKATGGVPSPVTMLGPDDAFDSLPSLLPDGRRFLYLHNGNNKTGIFAGSLDARPDQQPHDLVAPATFGATFVRSGNSSGGYLFFVRDGTLMAQPFDTKAMHLTGDPIPIVQQIGTGPSHAHFSVTAGGVMAYRTGPGNKYQLTWVDRTGKTLETIGAPALESPGEPAPSGISLSPDEKQVAIVRIDASSHASNIWLLDIARNIETRLTTGQNVIIRNVYGAIWSPDGKSLAYASGNGIYVKDTGGAADAKLVKDLGHPVSVTDWTRDGKFLIYDDRKDIRQIPVQGGEPVPVVTGDMEDIRGRISPDSRWVAYDSARSGRSEVYIRPYAVPGAGTAPAGPVIQISRDGGGAARWSADGTEIFFLTINDGLMAAKIERSNGEFRPEAPVQTGIQLNSTVWAAGKSDQRFLVDAPLDHGIQTPITVVTNWEGSLKQQQQ